ncbi:MAG: patatin-like phospholipase family protein [Bacteroidetes bacterium]|nr:patatin-like phospholipase family protein [Bacteroidota bacterium]
MPRLLRTCTPFIAAFFASFLLITAEAQTITVSPVYTERPTFQAGPLQFRSVKRPTVCLVLSGGGSRGMAHLGVIKELERNGIPIDYIVGTSIGAIIGGLYASGYTSQQLDELVDTTDWNYILSLTQDTEREHLYLSHKVAADRKQLTLRFDGLTPIIPSAISSGQRLTTFINQLTLQGLYHPVNTFDDLKIPFRCVSTDLISGQRIVFRSGNISEALRASMSIPLLYHPLRKDTMELTDGGLLANIPVDVAREFGADIIIAVDVTSPLRRPDQLNTPWEVTDQIVNIMAQEANRRALDSATIVITPDLGYYPSTDFSELRFAVQQGGHAARASIEAIRDSIEQRKRSLLYDTSPLANFSFVLRSIDGIPTLPGSERPAPVRAGDTTSIPKIRELLTELHRTGHFADVRGDVTVGGSGADVRITAEPNPVLRSVMIRGNTLIDSQSLAAPFQPLTGRPVNLYRLKTAFEQMLGLYRTSGYSLARIIATDFDPVTGTFTIDINEGVIHRIYLRGKEQSRDWVIWRELGFRDGNVFTVDKGKNALMNLAGTNLFDQILMDVGFEEGLPTVTIQLDEKPTEVSRLGFRLDNERNLQPSLEFRNENLLGTATEIGASFAGGLRNRKYIADFQANRIFNSYFTFNLDLYYDLRDIYTYADDPMRTSRNSFVRSRTGEYRQILYGVSFLLGQQVERLGTFNIEYRIEADEAKFISGTGYQPSKFTLQAFRISSTIDSRDRYPFARQGSLTNFSWETATSSLKDVVGDVGYSKIYFAYETNTSYENFTLHPRITVGLGDQTLPLTQQFSLGGEDSFFGLREYDSRGRQIFVTSLELRTRFPFQVVWDTYFRLRYDFGNIWPQREDIRIRDFHHGIGAILSLDTPAGPVNLSVGRSFYIRRDLLDQPLSLGPVVAYLSLGYPIL